MKENQSQKGIGKFERFVRIVLIFLLGLAAGYAWKTYHVMKWYEREVETHERNSDDGITNYHGCPNEFRGWIHL